MSLKYHYGAIKSYEQITNLLQFRWCIDCDQPKPPRAHHCSTCQRCILKYDHHCPWVGSCVGFRNHKVFCNFNTYIVMGCLYAAVGMMIFVVRSEQDEVKLKLKAAGMADFSSGWLFASSFIAIAFFLTVIGLTIVHCVFLNKN